MAKEELVSFLAINRDEWHAGSEVIAHVNPRNSCVLCRSCAQVVRQNVHVVAEEPKSEVAQQVGVQHITKSSGDALIACQRLTRKTVRRQSRPSHKGSKGSHGMLTEVCEAISSKESQLFPTVVVDTNIEIVVVELLASRCNVVLRKASPCHVRSRQQV